MLDNLDPFPLKRNRAPMRLIRQKSPVLLSEDEDPECPLCRGSGERSRGQICLRCYGMGTVKQLPAKKRRA